MLTEEQKVLLESIQRKATKIILSSPPLKIMPNFKPYEQRLEELKLEPLTKRWQNLFENLSLKLQKDLRFSEVIVENKPETKILTRRRETYIVPFARTNRLRNTTVIQAIHYLNSLTDN